MPDPILVAFAGKDQLCILPKLANRHGLIAGATGTGKTVTLQSLAQSFSQIGVPSFLADVKGDLAGLSQPGGNNAKVTDRLKEFEKLGMAHRPFAACPVTFWDVYGDQGHPVRTTDDEMGPLLLSRLLNLNDVQDGVLTIMFRVAAKMNMPMDDYKDIRAMLQYVADNAKSLTTEFGNISSASVGAIQRALLALEQQGGDKLFGKPEVNLEDFIQTNTKGEGFVNILAADKLMNSPKVYATFLMWMLTKLYEKLPEVGDPEKPKLVFFFDEAHLLFKDAQPALLAKIEQVVRLIRSKGVGVYFITQSPADVPDSVLAQLGNRVQHALRAFTPRDQKAVKTAAETFRPNPKLDTAKAITELAVGEALISFLEESGTPQMVERALVVPPASRLGPITPAERKAIMDTSIVRGQYDKVIDRESAFEMLKKRAEETEETGESSDRPKGKESTSSKVAKTGAAVVFGAIMTAIVRGITNAISAIVRGVVNSMLSGGKKKR
jgi:DNA helicase HerA-like ATPase